MRCAPIEEGISGLRLSKLLDADAKWDRHMTTTEETVRTWQHVVASPGYRDGLARTPNDAILIRAYWHKDPGAPFPREQFFVVLDGARCIAIDAEAYFPRFFELTGDVLLDDDRGSTLALALRWLRRDVLARVLARVIGKKPDHHVRMFTRDDVRAWRPLKAEGKSYRVIGPANETIALQLSDAEQAVLDRWLAGEDV